MAVDAQDDQYIIQKRDPVLLKWRILPIDEWLVDPYYVGSNVAGLPNDKGMWKFWADHFRAYFKLEPPKSTLIVTGSIRGGKSYNVYHFLIRYLYEISCFWDFPGLFGLGKSSLVLFVLLSVSKAKAKDSSILKLLRILDTIPYFHNEYPYRQDIRSKVVFPGIEVKPGSATDDLLSDDLFGVIFDEANFVKARAGNEYRKAQEIFTEARSRGQMTFSMNGVTRGFYALISSADSMSSFVEQQITQAKVDGTGYIVAAAAYKVKPWAFSRETFKVFCGVDDVPPHIVDEVEADVVNFIIKTYGMFYDDFLAEHEDTTEHVPIDFRQRYREDIVYALRSISGRPMSTQAAFLKHRKMFDAMFLESMKSPLMKMVPTLSLLSDDVIQDFVDVDALLELYELGAPLYIHIDLGLRGDVEGKAGDYAAFASAFKTEKGKIRSPFYCRIARVSSSDEIDTSKIEDIVYWLIEVGLSIKLVTKDLLARGYLSQNLVKRLGKERVADLSLDKTDVPFLIFSHLMKKGLFETYYYKPFVEEYPTLIHDRASQKVIKATGGHDDISQALIGAVYGCFQGEGMSLEALAIEETLKNTPGKKEFYEEALLEGGVDDYYSGLLDQVEEEHDWREPDKADVVEEDREAELERQIKKRENPEFTYGRDKDRKPRIRRDW